MGLSSVLLRIVLFLSGLFIIFTGIEVSFGGIETLGLQGRQDFFQVTKKNMFLIQDSHVRFLGGVWLGIGFLALVSPFILQKVQLLLKFCIALIFLGGLARFTQMQPAVWLGPEIIGSFILELPGMVILYFWLNLVCKKEGHTQE